MHIMKISSVDSNQKYTRKFTREIKKPVNTGLFEWSRRESNHFPKSVQNSVVKPFFVILEPFVTDDIYIEL